MRGLRISIPSIALLLWVAVLGTVDAAPSSWLSLILPRADCKTQSVEDGDTCASLAKKCDISNADFTKYNPDPKLCSSLQPDQRVCCSEGTLPDIRPKPYPNGTCASYVIKEDDTCASLEAKNGLKEGDIDDLNKVKTWGFDSCKRGLQKGLKICLSSGKAPMPAPVEGALCGPTKPGTKPPEGDTKLEDLNPCPLNACCNIWGQCGISGDFCVKTNGTFGNIGTGPRGSNGCVQNCGTDIVNDDKGPTRPISIGYYETWNMDRECMKMPVRSIRQLDSTYTHVHWAFVDVYQNLSVGVNDTYRQWADFVALPSGTKRIISFGGWGVSTSPETYDILRRACSPENREEFADNVVNLVKKYWLDGVDFDWEYPGAPDIPNIPPGEPDDGKNYLGMLKVVRDKLPEGKTLSIAAPASYWYLKAFPIDEIGSVVDYIVYMTYDLHGQWDYGNKWASSGCPAGDCLRSHVNITETMLALSMITKAGVPSSKIIVGLSSYGRSFKMTDPNCSGPMCTFVGPDSGAKPGKCTDAAGYIANAEIERIIKDGGAVKSWFDEKTMTDYLIYEGTQWVAYMTNANKAARMARWANMNFGGTVDWAVDLQIFGETTGCPSGTCDSSGVVYISPEVYTQENPIINCQPPCDIIFPPLVLESPTTISFPPYTTSLEVVWTETITVTDDGETSTSESLQRYIQTTTLKIPPILTTEIPFWNTHVSDSDNATVLWLTTSIRPPPFTITNDPNPKDQPDVTHPTVIRTITPPPWPYSFSKPTTTPTTKPEVTPSISFNRGPPGPTCTADCGRRCQVFCDKPCSNCPPSGVGPGDDFIDPNDPNPPAFPPPPDEPPPGSDPDACQPEVKTDIGFCPNGNMPVFDPISLQMRCDLSAEDAGDFMTSCQASLDEDIEDSEAEAEHSTRCCENSAGSNLLARQAGGSSCPAPPNPPGGGNGLRTFRCDFHKWPNVCANARSAINERGKPTTLTYALDSGLHPTKPWYDNKFRPGGQPAKGEERFNNLLEFDGWGLIDCEVEEYPWGSGNPNRHPNNKVWDEQSVLRLIPREENSNHGKALRDFYKDAGGRAAAGFSYTVVFVNETRTGRMDEDYYLGNDISENICAQPYGNAFLLVNQAEVNAGERSYDPWWDDKLFKKTIGYDKDANGQVTASTTTMTNSAYCQYPSPGKKIHVAGEWIRHGLSGEFDRRDSPEFYSCDNYPGYKGPSNRPARRRRGRSTADELAWEPANLNQSETAYMEDSNDDDQAQPKVERNVIETQIQGHQPGNKTTKLTARQLGGGSFVDASAFLYLGCGSTDDDLCYYLGDACSSSSADEGDWNSPDPPPPEPTPTTEPPPPPPPPSPEPEPDADCFFWDSLAAWQFLVFNIEGWAEDDYGDKLLDEERGCGALTGWSFKEQDDGRYQARFYLPFFISEGCVERAVKSAGGPDLSCDGQGLG